MGVGSDRRRAEAGFRLDVRRAGEPPLVRGGSGAQSISNTFFQPFLSYTTKDAWTFGLNAESSYDWKARQWTVPFNATVSKLVKFGKQPVSLGVGARYYADSPQTGPHRWGARLIVTFLFPD